MGSISMSHVEKKKVQFCESCPKKKRGSILWVVFEKGVQFCELYSKKSILGVIFKKKGWVLWVIFLKEGSILWVVLEKKSSILWVVLLKGSIRRVIFLKKYCKKGSSLWVLKKWIFLSFFGEKVFESC